MYDGRNQNQKAVSRSLDPLIRCVVSCWAQLVLTLYRDCQYYCIFAPQSCAADLRGHLHPVRRELRRLQPLQRHQDQHRVGLYNLCKDILHSLNIFGKVQIFFGSKFRNFPRSYMGHFCGALAGFLVGLVLLENRKVVTSS